MADNSPHTAGAPQPAPLAPERVASILAPFFGTVDVAQVSGKLNLKTSHSVVRAWLKTSDRDLPGSVILKILSEGSDPAEARHFQMERANHEFLTRCGFSAKPRLFGHGPSVMVLEDLGQEMRGYPDVPSAEKAVATLLARLHSGSIGLERDYHAILAGYGISTPPSRNVVPGKAAGAGWAVLSHVLREIGDGDRAFDHLIERMSKADPAPEWALGFIHDDFAQGRQGVISDAGLFLLDFERSRFGNIFADAARIMLGEVVISPDGSGGLHGVNFTPEFVETYCDQLKNHLFSPLPATFQNEFGRVAVLIALQIIGRCLELIEEGRFAASLNALVAEMCMRLASLLSQLDAHPELVGFLSAIGEATEPREEG